MSMSDKDREPIYSTDTLPKASPPSRSKLGVAISLRSAREYISEKQAAHVELQVQSEVESKTSLPQLRRNRRLRSRNNGTETKRKVVRQPEDPYEVTRRLVNLLFSAMGIDEETQSQLKGIIKNARSVQRLGRSTMFHKPALDNLEKMREEIVLCQEQQKKHQAACLLQSHFRMTRCINEYKTLQKLYHPEKLGGFQELITKEKVFVMNLATLVSQYIVPLNGSSNKEIRKLDTELKVMFSNIEEILSIHQKLLKMLHELPRTSWPQLEGLGEAFSSIAANWNVYGAYVNNYKFAQDLLQRLQLENEHFREFLERKSLAIGWDLTMLLSLPLNHIAGYPVYLRKILNHTTSEHEYTSLLQAISISEETSNYIASTLEKAETVACMRRLDKSIMESESRTKIFECLNNSPNADFVFEEHVEWSCGKRTGPGMLHLFKNICFLTTPWKGSNQVKYYYQLSDVTVEPVRGNPRSFALFIVDDERPSYDNIVPGTKYEFQVGSENSRKRWVQDIKKLISLNIITRTFGVPIETLIERDNQPDGVPVIIKDLVTFIEKTGMDTVGLFRVPGTSTIIKKVRRLYNETEGGKYPNLFEVEEFKPHDAAGVFKMFFHDLPDPLIPHRLYDSFLVVYTRYKKNADDEQLLMDIKVILNEIPVNRFNVLKYLLRFLQNITKHGENKMSAGSLATCFGPNILRPLEQTIESTLALPFSNKCVELMIQFYSDLFDISKEDSSKK